MRLRTHHEDTSHGATHLPHQRGQRMSVKEEMTVKASITRTKDAIQQQEDMPLVLFQC